MMRTKQRILVAALAGFIACGCLNAYAEEAKPKSVGVAWVLGLDPIPGDALFYAEKPVQGTINLLLGGLAIGSIVYAEYDNITCDKEASEGWCGLGSAVLALFVGAPLYATTLIWDAIGGISGVYSHNAKIQRRYGFLNTFQPTLAIGPNGGFVGAQFKF